MRKASRCTLLDALLTGFVRRIERGNAIAEKTLTAIEQLPRD